MITRVITQKGGAKPIMKHPLVGQFFHSFDNQFRVAWQGEIIAATDQGVLVQLFDWILGAPGDRRWCSWKRVEEWHLYGTVDAMHAAYEYRCRHYGDNAVDREDAMTE